MSEGARLTVLAGIADDQAELTMLRDWIIDTLTYRVWKGFAEV